MMLGKDASNMTENIFYFTIYDIIAMKNQNLSYELELAVTAFYGQNGKSVKDVFTMKDVDCAD